MTDWESKLTSRKWWMAVVTAAAGLVTAVTGCAADDAVVQSVGIVCAVVAAAVYQIVEGRVDAERVKADTKTTTVTATTSSAKAVAALTGTDAAAKAEAAE